MLLIPVDKTTVLNFSKISCARWIMKCSLFHDVGDFCNFLANAIIVTFIESLLRLDAGCWEYSCAVVDTSRGYIQLPAVNMSIPGWISMLVQRWIFC